jgi:hypothetical protein
MHAPLHSFVAAGHAHVPFWHVWPEGQSMSMQHAALSMHLPLHSRMPEPQAQLPPTHVRAVPQAWPPHVMSAQSTTASQVLSTPSPQISCAPMHGTSTSTLGIWLSTKLATLSALSEMPSSGAAHPLPPLIARPRSTRSLGHAACATAKG